MEENLFFVLIFSWWRYKYFGGYQPTVKIYYYALISILAAV